jgi:hypothetical protein
VKTSYRLSAHEKESLLKYPAYLSLLAGYSDYKLDMDERKLAVKFVHIKTFTCDPILVEFYREAEKVFEKNIIQLDKELPKEKSLREAAINKELSNLDKMVLKLGKDYALMMHISMSSYKEHVLKAHHNVVVDFVFPIPIAGITE